MKHADRRRRGIGRDTSGRAADKKHMTEFEGLGVFFFFLALRFTSERSHHYGEISQSGTRVGHVYLLNRAISHRSFQVLRWRASEPDSNHICHQDPFLKFRFFIKSKKSVKKCILYLFI